MPTDCLHILHLWHPTLLYFANKGPSSQSCGFSSSNVWMWELDHEESWEPKNWCFWTVVLEKSLESPLDCKESKSVNPKGNQSWILIGRTDAEAEAPCFGHLMWRTNSFEKTLTLGKTEGDNRRWGGWMASATWWTWVWRSSRNWWWTGNLACCSPWGHKESDMTEWLNFTCYDYKIIHQLWVEPCPFPNSYA